MNPEDLEIACKGKGRCGETFRLGEAEEVKINPAAKHLMAECPRCGKNTVITKKELGDKYDQVRKALSTKIEEGEKEKEENFEIYYADGDLDSIVADGSLDRLKRRTFKDGLQDAEVPEKVIEKILRRWDQDSELHKDYGKLVLMLQNYLQDLKKVNAGLVQQTVNDLCTLGRQYDNTIYDPEVKERPKKSEPAQRMHLRVPSSATRRAVLDVNDQTGEVLEEDDTREGLISELNKTVLMQDKRIEMLQKENLRLRRQTSPEPSISSVSQGQGLEEMPREETPVEPGARRVLEVEKSSAVAERLSGIETKLASMAAVKERSEEQEALRGMIREELSPLVDYYGKRREELDKGSTSDLLSHERELDKNDLERDRMKLERHKFNREMTAKESLYNEVGHGIRNIGQSIGEGMVSVVGLEETTEEGEKPAEEKGTAEEEHPVYMLQVKCPSCGNITHVPPEVERITCPSCDKVFHRSDAFLVLSCPRCDTKNEVPAAQALFDCSNCGQSIQSPIHGR